MSFYQASPISFESVSNVTATNSVELGTRRIEAGEEYVYCYNAGNSVAQKGNLMIQSGGVSANSLTISSTDALDIPMVGVKHATAATGTYFWGLVRGQMRVTSLAVTAGDLLTTGADGVCATFITATLPTGVCIGRAIDTCTASTQPLAHLRLWG